MAIFCDLKPSSATSKRAESSIMVLDPYFNIKNLIILSFPLYEPLLAACQQRHRAAVSRLVLHGWRPQVFVCTSTGFGHICTPSLPGYSAGAPESSWPLACDQENIVVVKT